MLKLTKRIEEVSKNLEKISSVDSQNLLLAMSDMKLDDLDVEKLKLQAEENTRKLEELESIILDYQIKSRHNLTLYKECLEIYEEKKQELKNYQNKIEKYLELHQKIKALYEEII